MATYREFAETLVKEAGKRARVAQAQAFETLHKGGDERDVVTSVDLEVNNFLISEIRRTYPEHRISSEEGGSGALASEYEWVLDPIDGSANFSRGIPHFAVSVGLLQAGTPLTGAVYNPITDELFSFMYDEGASINGSSMKSSSVVDLLKSHCLLHIGRDQKLWEWGLVVKHSLLEHAQKSGDFASSSLDLCFLAAGRVDVVIYGRLTTTDCAAAVGMVREAGGEVYSVHTGTPAELNTSGQSVVAVANKALFNELRPYLHAELLPS